MSPSMITCMKLRSVCGQNQGRDECHLQQEKEAAHRASLRFKLRVFPCFLRHLQRQNEPASDKHRHLHWLNICKDRQQSKI
ncbi:hypothetical protein NL676_002132 [Syzygium grande]|nr:hypothetical protein NL676_002132 [Syzygium grande]